MACKREHYIDNAEFTKAVSAWVGTKEIIAMKIMSKELAQLKRDKKDKKINALNPNVMNLLENSVLELRKKAIKQMPNYMAECFMKLVDRIGSRPNFMGYTYLDDMKGDALHLCTKYAHNFDPKKSSNAFAYFSQIVFNAFKQYLNKEKKYTTYRFELTKEMMNNAEKLNYNNITKSNRDVDGNYVDE